MDSDIDRNFIFFYLFQISVKVRLYTVYLSMDIHIDIYNHNKKQ